MTLFFIYPGKMGGGLESTLGPFEIAKELGIDCRLFLSKDNVRKKLIEKVYPEAEFYDFASYSDISKMKHEIKDGWSFFTMISPKMLPLYFSLKGKKIFYFHATYDHSFSRTTATDKMMDHFHDLIIRHSTLTLAPQHPMAWQVKLRLNRPVDVFPHPPYDLRNGFFEAEKKIDLPFKRFFLYFGDVSRASKGIDVLLKALEEHPELNAIIAGRGKNIPKQDNLCHMNGWTEDGAMHHMIKKSECVVLPYLIPSQFSGCLALSFHFRTPVIGSHLPTFEGWIEPDKTGWFFPSGDYKALGALMKEVWDGKRKHSKDAIRKKEREMREKSKIRLKEILEELGYSD